MFNRTFCKAQVLSTASCSAQAAAASIRSLLDNNRHLGHDVVANLTAAADALSGRNDGATVAASDVQPQQLLDANGEPDGIHSGAAALQQDHSKRGKKRKQQADAANGAEERGLADGGQLSEQGVKPKKSRPQHGEPASQEGQSDQRRDRPESQGASRCN